jgi:superfamily I DNA/RNA helicase
MPSDQYVDATICGVPVKGLKLMQSKYGGFDPHTGRKFPAGTLMAYLHQDRLTEAQKKAIFPNGRVTALTVQWPLQSGDAPAAKDGTPPKAGIVKPFVDFTPSEHQTSILDTLLNSEDHILIEALAGSGKTSTLVWLIKELAKRGMVRGRKIIYLAFNTKIKVELNEKLEGTGVSAMTTHGFGYKILKNRFGQKIEPHNGKCASNAFQRIICDDNGLRPTADGLRAARKMGEYKLRSAVLELVGYIKNWAIFPHYDGGWGFSKEQEAAIAEFVTLYGIEYPAADYRIDQLVQYAIRVVLHNLPDPAQATLSEVDFDDMLYLPLALNLPFPKYDLVLTDESQDFNDCQILMLDRLIAA